MTVAEILTSLARRLPIEIFKKYGEPGLLEIMNRRYKNLNREYKCLEKSKTITEAASVALTADWIEPFAMDKDNVDNWTYVNPEIFLADEDYIYTIKNNKIYFGNFDATNTITFDYFSSGLVLARALTTPDDGLKAISPEWQEESLHSLLFYAVLVELGAASKHDYIDYERLKTELHKSHYKRQAIQPNAVYTSGKSPKSRYIDDYEYPRMIHR